MDNKKQILGRISLFYWSVFLLGIAIVVQIVSLQFFSPKFKQKAKQQTEKPVEAYGKRGSIFTHDGRLLAGSLTKYELYVDFFVSKVEGNSAASKKRQQKNDSTFNADVDALSLALGKMFNEPKDKYKQLLKKGYADKGPPVKISPRLVSVLELEQVKKFPYFKQGRLKSGLVPAEVEVRNYPYDSLARRTLGVIANNRKPETGIEYSFNEYLCGKKGVQLKQRIAEGRWMPIDDEKNIPIEDGYDVITTLDADIQDAAETALIKKLKEGNGLEGGTAIVMEVETGEIRAMANMVRKANGTYGEIDNYALKARTAPGSTFKLVTLISLLEDGYVNLNTMVDAEKKQWEYKRKIYTEAHNYFGVIPVLKAFEKSSNIAFAKLSIQHYGKDPKKFVEHLRNMGIGDSLRLQIRGENPSIIPGNGDTKKWGAITLPQIATGYEVELAPIHTLTLYNAIANNGKMVKPKFVTEIRKNGQTIKTFPTETINSSICSPATAEQVKSAMEAVVVKGTAKHINSRYYTIAGKTGTAQMLFRNKDGKMVYYDKEENHKYQASFAGFFPSDKPRYAAIVVLYSPVMKGNFYGGTWAAPVFKEIADKAFSTNLQWKDAIADSIANSGLPPVKGGKGGEVNRILTDLAIPSQKSVSSNSWVKVNTDNGRLEADELNVQGTKVPSVVNMGLKEALCILENMGLKVLFTGRGAVKAQSIEPGTMVSKGQSIYLTLEG